MSNTTLNENLLVPFDLVNEKIIGFYISVDDKRLIEFEKCFAPLFYRNGNKIYTLEGVRRQVYEQYILPVCTIMHI